jgi:eukaryotic-like serine/threonine-protein kinase
MKCLEKAPKRRYDHATGIALDIERHLSDEPVLARPPSSLYRLQKLVRRHRLACAGATLSLVGLILGFAISTWLYANEKEAHRRARAAEREQSRLRQWAEAGEKTANALLLFRRGEISKAENLFHQIPRPLLHDLLRSSAGLNASDLLAAMGDRHGCRSEWAAAISDFEIIAERVPSDLLDVDWSRFHEAFAALLVQTGDIKRYRQHCQNSLLKARGTKDPLVAEQVAKACLILPDSGVDLGAVAALDDVALKNTANHTFYGFFQMTRGWIEYRRGHFASALDWEQRGLASPYVDDRAIQIVPYVVLAMAHYQLNHAAEAKTAYAQALGLAQAMPTPDRGGWDNYYCDWIIAHVLLREAKELLRTSIDDPVQLPQTER